MMFSDEVRFVLQQLDRKQNETITVMYINLVNDIKRTVGLKYDHRISLRHAETINDKKVADFHQVL